MKFLCGILTGKDVLMDTRQLNVCFCRIGDDETVDDSL